MHRAAVAATSLVVLAGCASAPGSPQASEQPRTESDRTDPERRAQLRLELASAYFARGQNETALDELKQALAIRPAWAEAYNLRGLIFANMGDPRLAEESFVQALKLQPRDGEAMHNYGWFLCQERRYSQAQAQLQGALDAPQYRDRVRSLLAMGVCQARDGRMDEAEHSLMRAYELDSANPTTAVNLSEVLLRRGQLERARFYVARVNAQPEQSSAQTLWLALRIENKLGNRDGVAQFGRELRNRFPQSPEARAYAEGRLDE